MINKKTEIKKNSEQINKKISIGEKEEKERTKKRKKKRREETTRQVNSSKDKTI